MDIVFSILIVLAIVVIFCKIRASNDNESITTREVAKSAYSYSKKYDTGSKGVLLVKMKSEAAVRALEFSEGHDLIVNNTPDKLVYTGATVGGVTTGGFHVQKGGTSVTQGDATGRWFVHYRFASEFNGKPWSDIVVYMQLTDQLFAEAKDNAILKDLIVTDETRKFWRTQYDHKEIAEVPNLLSVVSMDKITAEYLKNWLAGRT